MYIVYILVEYDIKIVSSKIVL